MKSHPAAAPLIISGTFLDEISHDIPHQNWGPREWDLDFQAMKSAGLDTVILIRAGYRDRCTFDSRTIRSLHPALLVEGDLVDLFLTLAERYGLKLFFGTYDSGRYWEKGQYQEEIDLNRRFLDEAWARYGHRAALQGWYLCHETHAHDEGVMRVYETLVNHLRAYKNLPVLISPYIRGRKVCDHPTSVEEHAREWDAAFARLRGLVDIVAFQDGHVDYAALQEYLAVNAELARRHGLQCWSNVETFDRDLPIRFYPPIAWPKLKFKIDAARAAGVDKLITFEFSHFLSPHSMYPAAHHLHQRYREAYLDR